MYELIRELYPICRSLTGDGVRATLDIVKQHIPLTVHEVPTGTQAFDWTVPKEWNIRDAYIADATGQRVVDFKRSNLHVVAYSRPLHAKLSLQELRRHLHTLPEHPDWVPYRTAYYDDTWGFCLSHHQLLELQEEEYEVCIDASLEDGSLTYAEAYLPGEIEDEVLLCTHICHPSLCNDNLSGMALLTSLVKHLQTVRRRYSYRVVFLPGAIGAITWLCLNEARAPKIRHGLVMACVGDPGRSTYKKSRRGNAEIDRAVAHVLEHSRSDYEILDFSPYGYAERHFCSPGFNLPVGCLMRTPHHRFPQYHTSADDLDFVRAEFLDDSFAKAARILSLLEENRRYLNKSPKCEPQLGRRGLYGAGAGPDELAMLWVLNFSDGTHTLLDIAERSGLYFGAIKAAADALEQAGLLKECPREPV